MSRDLPMPTCKFCKEPAEDCVCDRSKDRPEWIPVNPCNTCPEGPYNDPQAYDGCAVYQTCVIYGMYCGAKLYQKKLLEYLNERYGDIYLGYGITLSFAFNAILKRLGVNHD